jgi:hypothetical protein
MPVPTHDLLAHDPTGAHTGVVARPTGNRLALSPEAGPPFDGGLRG